MTREELEERCEELEDAHARLREENRQLVVRCEEFQAFIRELPCDCYDEYGHKLAVTCDRCRLLADKAKEE